MKIEVSNGEIIDKYTILTIKLQEIKDEAKLANVQNEYDSLTPEIEAIYAGTSDQKALEELHIDLLIQPKSREQRFKQLALLPGS